MDSPMTLPTPDDLAEAPLWENYVVAQLTQAALGLVPVDALAIGAIVDGFDISLVCQVREETDDTVADLDEIAQELHFLVGERARISTSVAVHAHPTITPHDRTVWIFAARTTERR